MTRALLSILIPCLPLALAQAPAASDLATTWKASGQYFSWQSSLPENQGKPALQIFYACLGDQTKPAMVMVHGFPTSSFDFHLLSQELKSDYRMCMFDFPGYGYSDKPAGGYRYSLKDDAELVWHFVTRVVPMREFSLLSHDRGDSVSLAFLSLYQAALSETAGPAFRITHQYILNGNVYLPLANLTDFQKRMLDPATSAAAVKAVTPALLAAGLGSTTHTPALKPDDPEVKAMAAQFAYQSGVQVLPVTIQYLNERKEMELTYLQVLARSAIPVTLIWGVHDMIAPVRVADYVWDTWLKSRKAAGAYWIVPCGNHYLQDDQPAAIAGIIRAAVGKPGQAAPLNLNGESCAPVLVAQASGQP
jgi:pimeloyl-ACP methyl ester carboxylesterase